MSKLNPFQRTMYCDLLSAVTKLHVDESSIRVNSIWLDSPYLTHWRLGFNESSMKWVLEVKINENPWCVADWAERFDHIWKDMHASIGAIVNNYDLVEGHAEKRKKELELQKSEIQRYKREIDNVFELDHAELLYRARVEGILVEQLKSAIDNYDDNKEEFDQSLLPSKDHLEKLYNIAYHLLNVYKEELNNRGVSLMPNAYRILQRSS